MDSVWRRSASGRRSGEFSSADRSKVLSNINQLTDPVACVQRSDRMTGDDLFGTLQKMSAAVAAKNDASLSDASTRAIVVLPVPGGPDKEPRRADDLRIFNDLGDELDQVRRIARRASKSGLSILPL